MNKEINYIENVEDFVKEYSSSYDLDVGNFKRTFYSYLYALLLLVFLFFFNIFLDTIRIWMCKILKLSIRQTKRIIRSALKYFGRSFERVLN